MQRLLFRAFIISTHYAVLYQYTEKAMKLLKTKTLLVTILFCLLYSSTFCQPKKIDFNSKGWVLIGGSYIDTLHITAAQLQKVHAQLKIQDDANLLKKDHYYYTYPFTTGDLGIRFKSVPNKKMEIYEGNDWGGDHFYKSVLLQGNGGVEFSAFEINEKNAADFRYHVVQNDNTELVSWTQPSTFKYTADGKLKYAYLGVFNYVPGQVLTIEIYNIKNYRQRDAVMADWRPVEAANVLSLMQFFTPEHPEPDNGLISTNLNEAGMTSKEQLKLNKMMFTKPAAQVKKMQDSLSKDIRFHLADTLQNIDFFINNGKRMYNYKVSLKREIAGRKDSINLGETNTRFDLYKEFWKTPGNYTVYFTPKIHRHGGMPFFLLRNLTTKVSFTVLPAVYRKVTVGIPVLIGIVVSAIFIVLVVFTIYRVRQRQLLAKEAQNRQIATLQLQSVRAQLNPHFMFNALAGIQNLVNKNDMEGANKYLAKFARITRNVLDDNHKELVSIEHETDMLNDYLQMEQMRFGFNYSIDIDAHIDQQVEIPTMLLQPFAENAVKHGVSALKDKGMITVTISATKHSFVLSVQDNGKGFGANPGNGKGIKLCEERINLLNSIYKNSGITLHKQSDNRGTLIIIELKNWV